MIRLICLLLLSFACLFVNAQWRGDIGFQRNPYGGWRVRGGTSYGFANGRGNFGAHGFIDHTGNKGYGVSLSYKWGRRRRSIDEDTKELCSECVKIQSVTSPEKLNQYASTHKVDFGMVARFKRFYQNENETILNFRIKEVLEEPPTDLNISKAKVFNIFAEKSSCAMICLKDFIRQDYLITGAMFHGRLIIHDNILLFHRGLPKADKTESDEVDEEVDDDDDQNDNEKNEDEQEDESKDGKSEEEEERKNESKSKFYV